MSPHSELLLRTSLFFLFAVGLLSVSRLSLAAPGDAIKKPKSLSYMQMTDCFPDLEDATQEFSVSLPKIHDRLDEKYPTVKSQRVLRIMKFRDASGGLRRLRLETDGEKVAVTTAHLEAIDSKGASTQVSPLPVNAKNPTPAEINRLLSGNDLESDEITELDTKLNGFRVRTKKDFARWLEVRVEDPQLKKTLVCESNKEIGTICTCTKR